MEKSEIISLIILICSASAVAIFTLAYIIILNISNNLNNSIFGSLFWMFELGTI